MTALKLAKDLRRNQRGLWWLLLAAVVVLASGLGLRDPWPADEPRFALVARQMFDSGQWLVPMRGIELYSDKPPLFFWLQAIALSLGFAPRVAFLLPSLLASLGTLWLVYDLAKRLWSPRVGLWAAVLLLASMHFVFQGKKAQIDPTLVFFVTLSAYGLLRHLLDGPRWGWYFVGWFAAGLGILAKGVGFLPLLLLPLYVGLRVGARARLPAIAAHDRRWYLLSLGLPAACALWFLPIAYLLLTRDDPLLQAWAHDLFFRQTAERFVNPWSQTGKGVFYYFGVVALMWMPLSLALPWLIPAWWRRIRYRVDARLVLPLFWVVLVIGFFSLSPGKRDVYILPALPLLAVAAAPLMSGISRRAGFRWVVFLVAAGLASIMTLAAAFALLGEPKFELRWETGRGLADTDALWWMLLVVGGIGSVVALWARPARAGWAWAGVWAPVWILAFGFWGYPLLNDVASARAVMERARAAAGPEAVIGLVAWKEQNLLHLEGPHQDFGFLRKADAQWRDALPWLAQAPDQRRIFALATAVQGCVDRRRVIPLGIANRREWWLFGVDAVTPSCYGAGP